LPPGFLIQLLRDNLDPGTVRTFTNRAIAGFATAYRLLWSARPVALLKVFAHDARDRAQNPLPEKTKEIPKEIAEEQKFRALAQEAPISEWLPTHVRNSR
jgi:hypothetical protein